MNLILAAIDKAQSSDPENVRAALATISQFNGVTGSISYKNGSQIPTKPVALIEINGGKLVSHGEVLPIDTPKP